METTTIVLLLVVLVAIGVAVYYLKGKKGGETPEVPSEGGPTTPEV